MIEECFRSVQQELACFTRKNNQDSSSGSSSSAKNEKEWVMRECAAVIQQYPHSLSRAVLLTELESRWRGEIRRGEHGGKLQQMVSTNQLSLDTAIHGRLQRIDAHRCRLVEDAASSTAAVDMIMHGQFNDFVAFSRYSVPDYDVLDNRLCSFINGRLLPFAGAASVLLPCPLGILYMDVVNHHGDAKLYHEILRPMHDFFCRASLKGKENAPDTAALLHSLTDPGAVTAVLVQVLAVGDSRPHPTRPQSQYQVVRLRMLFTRGVETCVILFDDQLRLSALWSKGQVLLLFRPFVALNSDEPLFGSAVPTAAPMAYTVVSKPVAELSHYLDLETAMPVHFLYGAVTVVAEMRGISEEHIGERDTIDVDTNADGCLLVRVLHVNRSARTSHASQASHAQLPPAGHKPTPSFVTMLLARVGAASDASSALMRVAISVDGSRDRDEQLLSSLSSVRGGHLLLLSGLCPLALSADLGQVHAMAASTDVAEETASMNLFRAACSGGGCSLCVPADDGRSASTGLGRCDPDQTTESAAAVPWFTLGGGGADTADAVSRRRSASLVNVSRLAALTTSTSLLGANSPPRCLCSSRSRITEGLVVVTARIVRCLVPTVGASAGAATLCTGGVRELVSAVALLESAQAPYHAIYCFCTPDTLNMSSADPLQGRAAEGQGPLSLLLTRIDDVGGTGAAFVANQLQLQLSAVTPSLLFRVEVISDLPPRH